MKKKTFTFGLATGAMLLAAQTSFAAVPASQAALLQTTLTPVGAERAGNADGSIPAWTGGVSTPPAGWRAGQPMPDIYSSEKPILVINASNVDQYKDRLAVGAVLMIQKYGYYMNIYPTHRAAAFPADIVANTYQNALNAQLDPKGGRFGLTGAFGGPPFPILSGSPLDQGAEAVWNAVSPWDGRGWNYGNEAWIIENGRPTLEGAFFQNSDFPYYDSAKKGTTASQYTARYSVSYTAPARDKGLEDLVWFSQNPGQTPDEFWQYLNGQGRVRKAPDLFYDTPAPSIDGLVNEDEYSVFDGALDDYNWRLVGKKEMYVPYNQDQLALTPANVAIGPHFLNPSVVRWELHRVWVIDATVASDRSNTIPHRILYLDEDTWSAMMGDTYDSQGKYWRFDVNQILLQPNIPAEIHLSSISYDLQRGVYSILGALFGGDSPVTVQQFPESQFQPQEMAAQAQF